MIKGLVTAPFDQKRTEMLDGVVDLEYSDVEINGEEYEEDRLIEKLKGKQVLIVELQEVTEKVVRKAEELKIVGCCRGGPVNINISAASNNHVTVFNSPGRNAEAVAELTIAMMIGFARNMFRAESDLNKGQWGGRNTHPYHEYKGYEIFDKKIGLVGFGWVAKELAKRLQGFKAEVLVYDPYVSEAEISNFGAKKIELDKLLEKSDFVSLHARVNDETKGMIDKKEFDAMKEDACFVNTARAALVNEEAMLEALRENKIAGAALDVFHQEPLPKDDLLLELDNVIKLPHIGGATTDVISHHTEIISNSIAQFLEGNKPDNLYNLDELGERTVDKIRDELVAEL